MLYIYNKFLDSANNKQLNATSVVSLITCTVVNCDNYTCWDFFSFKRSVDILYSNIRFASEAFCTQTTSFLCESVGNFILSTSLHIVKIKIKQLNFVFCTSNKLEQGNSTHFNFWWFDSQSFWTLETQDTDNLNLIPSILQFCFSLIS